MAKKDFVFNHPMLLKQMQEGLEASSVGFGTKVNVSLSLMELSLNTLARLGVLKKLVVEASGKTSCGTRMTWNYRLGTKRTGEATEEYCVRRSFLEEDE